MEKNHKELYLAGGCFWGTQKYFALIEGVLETQVGYANGNTAHPTYQDVCNGGTGHAETVKISYDPRIVSLPFLLERYYEVIDPTSVNRQGNDVGTQYRTGIYYVDEGDKAVIAASIKRLQRKYKKPIAIQTAPLLQYAPAEGYHQAYLDKNPGGYCHIPSVAFDRAKNAIDKCLVYAPKTKEEYKQTLTDIQYRVTQENATEPPFQNDYFDRFDAGIYVDCTTGEPLFVSTDKFESGCGWPAFSKPIDKEALEEINDFSHGMMRTEVRSKTGRAHLGHVFPDGPPESGGLRYCINSAALRFIPLEQMESEGYAPYKRLVK